jgi:hypothetical protein
MHLQEPGNLCHRFAVLLNELTRVGDLFGRKGRGGPNRTPRALAAIRPALVRSTIKARSKSAMPANTVNTMRPAGVVEADATRCAQRRALLVEVLALGGDARIAYEWASRARFWWSAHI